MAILGSNPNPGPAFPPNQSPNFNSGQNPQGLGKIILLIIVVAVGGYFYNFSKNNWQDFGTQFNEFTKSIDSTMESLDESSNSSSSNQKDHSTLNQKLNAYVALLNYVSEDVYRSYDRYLDWVDPTVGVTGKEKNVYGLYKINDYQYYLDEAQKAFLLEPEINLDQTYLEYQKSYQKLKSLVNQAYDYYDQKDYLDDGFAKAKSMHTDLIQAFQDFDQISLKFNQQFEVIDLAERQNELIRFEQEGRLVALNTTKAYSLAQTIYIQIRDQLAQNNNDASKIDLTELKKKIDQYEQLLATLNSQKSHTTDLETEYGITAESLYSSYYNASQTLFKSTKALYRALKNNQVPKRDTFSKYTEGTPENVIYTYNQVVNSFNSLNRY